MSWLSLTVNVDAAYAENLSEALLEFGALSVDMHDADADTPQEQAIFGEPGEPPPACGRITASPHYSRPMRLLTKYCCWPRWQQGCRSHHRTT